MFLFTIPEIYYDDTLSKLAGIKLWYSQGVVYKDIIIPVGTYTKQPN